MQAIKRVYFRYLGKNNSNSHSFRIILYMAKQNIDSLLSAVTAEDLRKFVKTYSKEHPEMVEALKDFIVPKEDTLPKNFNVEKEVARCYTHEIKSVKWQRGRSWEPEFQDIEEIGKDLKQLIRKGQMFIDGGQPEVAVRIALAIIKENEDLYYDDYLHEREDWDSDDLHVDDCIKLLEKAIKSSVLSKEQKLDVCDKLEKLSCHEIFDYSDKDPDDLIEKTRKELLTDEEQIAILMRNFNAETTSWQREALACEVFWALANADRQSEAEAFFHKHYHYDDLRKAYVEYLLDEDRTEEALKTVDEGIAIAKKKDFNGTERDWKECKLGIYESIKDKPNMLLMYREMFMEAYHSEVMTYYHKIKKAVAKKDWAQYRDELLQTKKNFSNQADGPLAEIYVEENLIDKLYEYLLHANCNLLHALELWSKLLSVEQQETLVAHLEPEIMQGLGYQPTRKTYQDLACRIGRIKKLCPAGKALAEKAVAFYLNKYPKRPALREELEKI